MNFILRANRTAHGFHLEMHLRFNLKALVLLHNRSITSLNSIFIKWTYVMSSQNSVQRHSAPALNRRGLSGPALRTFFQIAELWKLSNEEQMTILGVTTPSTFFKWKKDTQTAVLSKDALERISYIVGIYQALQILLTDERAADAWIKAPNTASLFGGRSALDRMLSGQVADLYVVRQYLDAQRGGWA